MLHAPTHESMAPRFAAVQDPDLKEEIYEWHYVMVTKVSCRGPLLVVMASLNVYISSFKKGLRGSL